MTRDIREFQQARTAFEPRCGLKTMAAPLRVFDSDCELMVANSQWVPPEYKQRETSNLMSYLQLIPAYRISL